MTYMPCIPGTGPSGEWRCAVCGAPGTSDCLPEPHASFDPKDWYQPDVVMQEEENE